LFLEQVQDAKRDIVLTKNLAAQKIMNYN